MSAENRLFSVRLHLGDSSRDLVVSAPGNLHPTRVVNALVGFSMDSHVRQELVGIKKDCIIQMIMSNDDIIGISIPGECRES